MQQHASCISRRRTYGCTEAAAVVIVVVETNDSDLFISFAGVVIDLSIDRSSQPRRRVSLPPNRHEHAASLPIITRVSSYRSLCTRWRVKGAHNSAKYSLTVLSATMSGGHNSVTKARCLMQHTTWLVSRRANASWVFLKCGSFALWFSGNLACRDFRRNTTADLENSLNSKWRTWREMHEWASDFWDRWLRI